MLTIREIDTADLYVLQELYERHLKTDPPPEPVDRGLLLQTLQRIVDDENHHILIGDLDGTVVASVSLIVIKNLTHSARPFAIIENVVTHADYRGRGFATVLMARAQEIAVDAGCYKIMLMTGSKKESTLGFYERCGFNRQDKTGFIKWL